MKKCVILKRIGLIVLTFFACNNLFSQARELPEKLDMIYLEYHQTADTMTRAPYSAVRIGEYYWLDNNVNHYRTFGSQPGVEYATQAQINTYLDRLKLDKSQFQVNINDFNKYYGLWYHSHMVHGLSGAQSMYNPVMYDYSNGVQGEVISGFTLPYNDDFRQLFAMCPFNTSNDAPHIKLNERDVRFALAPKEGDHPMAFNIYGEYGTYWFDSRYATNMYGFNMMPAGGRPDQTHTESLPGFGTWVVTRGGFYQLFYVAKYITRDGGVDVEDVLRFYVHPAGSNAGTWTNVRWCKRIPDEELGYKLYYNNDEQNPDIIKLGITETAPAGYTELPKGYLRGFYVQYILDNPKPQYTIKHILQFAKCVEDPNLPTPDCDCSKLIWEPANIDYSLAISFSRDEREKNHEISPNEQFTVFAQSETPDRIKIGLFDSSTGQLIKQISNTRSGYNYSCVIAENDANFNNREYLIMAYTDENNEVQLAVRNSEDLTKSHIIDKLIVKLINTVTKAAAASSLEIAQHMRMNINGDVNTYQAEIGGTIKILVTGEGLNDIKLGLFSQEGFLVEELEKIGQPLASSGNRFTYTCRIPDSYNIYGNTDYIVIPYVITNGQIEYINFAEGRCVVDRLPLYVIEDDPWGFRSFNIKSTDNTDEALEINTTLVSKTLFITGSTKIDRIDIYNMAGKAIKSEVNKTEIDISELTPNTYIIKIEINGNVYSKTIYLK